MKKLLIAIIAVVMIILTAYITYRVTMRNITIELENDTAYLTVYGMTDEYTLN